MTDLSYVDVPPILAKIADLGREFVLVGGQAVNFWASFYQGRVPALAREAPFEQGHRLLRRPAIRARLRRAPRRDTKRVATFDDATPNGGTVVFVDAAGVTRTLDVVSAPFGLDSAEVHGTAVPVELPDEGGHRRASASTLFPSPRSASS